MTPVMYLNQVLNKYNTISAFDFPYTPAYQSLVPIIKGWGNEYNLQGKILISGSNAKGTAIAGEADIDLLLSLDHSTLDRGTLREIYNSLALYLRNAGYNVRRQNVSVRINHYGYEIDLVPGVKFGGNTNDHWLHVTKSGRDRTKTNIDVHIQRVSNSGRTAEIRLTKIWRKINGLDFPSIYLEESVIRCLSGYRYGNVDSNFLTVLDYLSEEFINDRIVDPANSSNIISDDLFQTEKEKISATAIISRRQPTWGTMIW
jgi:tRNA nucleotidyltransferase (CCA-adding enzyme)